jgi:hypothetical protein
VRESADASGTGAASRTRRGQATGRLTLDAKPWARVYLGRRFLGVSPLVEIELPAGPLELRLVNPDTGIERTINVVVSEGGVVRTAVDLRAETTP